MKTKNHILRLTLLSLVVSGSLFLWGCGNDNPKPSSNLITIDIGALKKQLSGNQISSQSFQSEIPSKNTVDNAPVMEEIKTLIVGPVAFLYHCAESDWIVDPFPDDADGDTSKCKDGALVSPYNTDNGFTEIEEKQMTKDMTNSINYIVYIPFTSDNQEVTLSVPKDGILKWQVLAIAAKNVVENNTDLENGKDEITNIENGDSFTYIGLTKDYYTSAENLNNSNATITLIRACSLNNTPLGCAVYHDNGDAKVTSGVEIIKVEVNMINGEKHEIDNPKTKNDELPIFPWIIRDPKPGNSNEYTPTEAISYLSQIKPTGDWTIKDTFTNSLNTIQSIKITTTHKNSLSESTTCKTSTTLAELLTNCEKQIYPKFYYY